MLPVGPTAAGDPAVTRDREALTDPGTSRRLNTPADVVSRTALASTTAVPRTSPPKSVNPIAPPCAATCRPGVEGSASGVAIEPSVVATVYFSPSWTKFPPESCNPEAVTPRVAVLSAATESAGDESAITPEGTPGRRRIEAEEKAPPRSATTAALPMPATVPTETYPRSWPEAPARSWCPGAPGSSSVTGEIGGDAEPVSVNRSPAATVFPYTSRAVPETSTESTPFAISVSGVAVSAIDAGTKGAVKTGAPAVPR